MSGSVGSPNCISKANAISIALSSLSLSQITCNPIGKILSFCVFLQNFCIGYVIAQIPNIFAG